MAQNVKTPAGANGEGSGRDVCLAADTSSIAPRDLQIHRLRALHSLSPAYASVLAEHVYGVSDTWRAAR